MFDKKTWADAAHYYSKSGIQVQKTFKPEFLTSNIGRKITIVNGGIHAFDYSRWEFWSKGHSDQHILKMIPILRHRDDMTREEADQLFEADGLVWDHSSASDFATSALEWYKAHKFSKPHPEYTPNEFHWLISRGYDLFSLIESGQAIRREAQHG